MGDQVGKAYQRLVAELFPGKADDLLPLRSSDIGPVKEIIESLSEEGEGSRYAVALNLLYGLNGEPALTQSATGKILGLSKAGVSQWKLRTFRKLRHPSRKQAFEGLYRSHLDGIIKEQGKRIEELEEILKKCGIKRREKSKPPETELSL